MTNSPAFVSEPPQSAAFSRLHPRMQRWIYDQGWTSLHDAQEQAIRPILDRDKDVIIAAATAAGKTEAAFLPILSTLMTDAESAPSPRQDPWVSHDPWAEPSPEAAAGVQVVYLSPLKALINDQHSRLEQLCERADIPVHRWHGDVPMSSKRKVLTSPSGVLLITPESLEATFVTRGTQIPRLFAALSYIVVDELHSFLATTRGAQLQSLINRLELATRRRPPRIGLSATLGDMSQAASFLRPTSPDRVNVIQSDTDGGTLKLQLRGYIDSPPPAAASRTHSPDGNDFQDTDNGIGTGANAKIAEHLFITLRGSDNLVFANARSNVEHYADLLTRRSAKARVPNEFWPHHGNLSKDMRETVEAQLKDRTRPATAVCTSTLEMGIDIGSVETIAQIGPPPSVAGLRQRLGRSGRRGNPAVLRIYVTESHLDSNAAPVDELRCALVQATAMVRLMLARWMETPDDPGFNYSTLIQQTMSTIAQHGGAKPVDLYNALCGAGPFQLVNQTRYARLLRAMATHDLITQTADGLLLHGTVGERYVNHYSFYTAFQTPIEWKLIAKGRTLGTIPITQPLHEGALLIFAGRRWKVTGVDETARLVELQPSTGGNPPNFTGSGTLTPDEVRAEMVAVYQSARVPPWLDPTAQDLLTEARAAYRRYGLHNKTILTGQSGILLFPWIGDRTLFTATIALRSKGIGASVEGPTIRIPRAQTNMVAAKARQLLAETPPTRQELATLIENRTIDKWDWALNDDLSHESAGARLLDIDGAWKLLAKVTPDLPLS